MTLTAIWEEQCTSVIIRYSSVVSWTSPTSMKRISVPVAPVAPVALRVLGRLLISIASSLTVVCNVEPESIMNIDDIGELSMRKR